MKVLFSTNTLNYRGTTGAILDYAKYNQEVLGNESIITYNETISNEVDMGNEKVVIDNITKDFQVVCNQGLVEPIANDLHVDLVYRIGSGEVPSEILTAKNVYHAVFQFANESITAYVSKWLSSHLSNMKVPYVPHIVQLPNPTKDYREHFNIPKDAIVIGRHGGYTTFDIPFVKQYIKTVLDKNKNLYFLFMNTLPFVKHERVIHIGPVSDKQKISNFINTCDAMIHARQMGESFGLSIAEFLFHNKPVFSWHGGFDKNHLELTKYLYTNKRDLDDLITNVKDIKSDVTYAVKEFSPDIVMNMFNNYFIKDIKIK